MFVEAFRKTGGVKISCDGQQGNSGETLGLLIEEIEGHRKLSLLRYVRFQWEQVSSLEADRLPMDVDLLFTAGLNGKGLMWR